MLKTLLLMILSAGMHSGQPTGQPVDRRQEMPDTCSYDYNKSLKKKVYTKVETDAEFPDGAIAYMRFINKNLRVPAESVENGQYPPSSVFEFVVDTDGSIYDPVVNNKADTLQMDAYEKEILRLIKIMPRWQPASCNGKPVAVRIRRPLVICIREE